MRFHFGVSFRWKTIRKFLLPFIIGFLAYFGFNGFNFGFLNAFAYENTSTSWNLTIPNYNSLMQDVSCGNNGSMYDVVNDIITNYDSNYYDLFIGSPVLNGSSITLYLSQKNSPYDLLLYSGSVSTNEIIMQLFYSTNTFRFPYYVLTSDTCSTYQSRTDWGYFKILYETNVNNGGLGYQNYEYNQYSAPIYGNTEQLSNLNNNDDFNTSIWFYYSSKQLQYSYYTNNNYYGKNLCITNNNTCYSMGDNIPAYYDIADIPSNSFEIGDISSLKSIYTNFPSDRFRNFDLTIELDKNNTNITGYDYSNNLVNNDLCRGRVNHNNQYYTYEYLSCTFEKTVDSSGDHISIEFNNLQFWNNNTEITDLSSYDKIFLTLPNLLNDSHIDMSATNVSINFPLGNLLYNDYLGSIYDNFDSLSSMFKFYLSSNQSYSSDVYSRITIPSLFTTGFVFWSQYNVSTLNPTSVVGNISSSFSKISVSNANNNSVMIFQNEPNVLVEQIEFIFDKDLVISYSGSSSDNFYYIDSNGDIQNSNITVDYDNVPNNNYDISYYVNKVNDFINDLSDDTLVIAGYTQLFYDSMPLVFQSFLFVLFILACIYFSYLLIKR